MKVINRSDYIICLILALFMLNSCEDVNTNDGNYYLEIDAPSLINIADGYYSMAFLEGYNQTFTTLRAQTGSMNTYQKLSWISNKEVLLKGIWTNLVNTTSYTDEEGIAYTVLGVWEEFTGDTIRIYCGYNDESEVFYLDSINVIIE